MRVSIFSNWKYGVAEWSHQYLSDKSKEKEFTYLIGNYGQTFFLETTSDTPTCCMTSQQVGLKSGDHVQIYHPDIITTYQIKEIEYDEQSPDIWMAELLEVEAK